MNGREPLTPEERELAEAIGTWRVGDPPSALDRSILAQARAEASGGKIAKPAAGASVGAGAGGNTGATGASGVRRRRRPLQVGLATAAALVLAVGIAWQVLQAPERPLHDAPSTPVMDAAPGAAARGDEAAVEPAGASDERARGFRGEPGETDVVAGAAAATATGIQPGEAAESRRAPTGAGDTSNAARQRASVVAPPPAEGFATPEPPPPPSPPAASSPRGVPAERAAAAPPESTGEAASPPEPAAQAAAPAQQATSADPDSGSLSEEPAAGTPVATVPVVPRLARPAPSSPPASPPAEPVPSSPPAPAAPPPAGAVPAAPPAPPVPEPAPSGPPDAAPPAAAVPAAPPVPPAPLNAPETRGGDARETEAAAAPDLARDSDAGAPAVGDGFDAAIQQIRTMVRRGEHDAARERLAALRRQHPQRTLPDDLAWLIPRPDRR